MTPEKFYQLLNHKIWRNDETDTVALATGTAMLLNNNWWYDWFQSLAAVALSPEQQHQVALSWLTCPLWQHWNTD